MPVWVANAAKVVCRPHWANKYFFSTMMWAHTCSQPQSPYLVIDTDKFLAALSLILPLPNLKQIKPTSTHAEWSLYVAYAVWNQDFESDPVYTWGPIFGSACFSVTDNVETQLMWLRLMKNIHGWYEIIIKSIGQSLVMCAVQRDQQQCALHNVLTGNVRCNSLYPVLNPIGHLCAPSCNLMLLKVQPIGAT